MAHEGWAYAKDGHVAGKFEAMILVSDTAVEGTADQWVTMYNAVVYLRQDHSQPIFIAAGHPVKIGDEALHDLLFVTAAALNKVKHQVLDFGDGSRVVGGGLVNAKLVEES